MGLRPTNPLRVLIYDPSGHGGVCQYTHSLAQEMAKSISVTVLASAPYELIDLPRRFRLLVLFDRSRLKSIVSRFRTRRRPGTEPAGGRTETLGGFSGRLRRWRIRLLLGKLALGVRFRRPDVFHVQWLVARDEEWDFLRRLKRAGIPLVHTAHDLLPHGSDSDEDRAFFGRLYRFVDRVIVHTERNRAELRDVFDLDEKKIVVIPHGSSTEVFAGGLTKHMARNRLGLQSADRVILFLGMIKRYKGLEYLVKAFASVRNRVSSAKLLIVGMIDREDPESATSYSRLLEGLAGRSDVMVVPEYVPFERLATYLVAADVVALPYVKTYQSGVLLWAYAAGRPVVVTSTGGLGESVEPGKSGYVVPPRDARALADALVRVIESCETNAAMGAYARMLAETRYSWANVSARTIDLYRELAGRNIHANAPSPSGGTSTATPGRRRDRALSR